MRIPGRQITGVHLQKRRLLAESPFIIDSPREAGHDTPKTMTGEEDEKFNRSSDLSN